MQLEDHESRPACNGTASYVVDGDALILPPTTDSADVPRCLVCGHLITSPASIAAGIGQTCRRRLRRALIEAEPEVVAAVFAALAVLSCGEVA